MAKQTKNSGYQVPGMAGKAPKASNATGEISKRLKGTKYLAKIKSVPVRSTGSARVRTV